MPYTGCIIQARLSSTRLPMKVVEELNGIPILEHVVNRVRRADIIDQLVIAAPHQLDVCMNEDLFIGSEDDVLDRYYQCALEYKFDIIVRITADCPFVPPYEIDRVVNTLMDERADYATNRPSVPDGWDVEAMTFKSLELAHKNTIDQYDREHVTPWIKRNDSFRKLFLDAPKLSLDTPDDLERIRRWYEYEMV